MVTFSIFMNQEFRSVVHFCWLLQKGPTETHNLMKEAYGTECPSLFFVKKWDVEFQNGREILQDLPSSGRPTIEENIVKVSAYIKNYPFSSARAISAALDISLNNVLTILKEKLHMKKKHSKYVPHILNDSKKVKRCHMSRQLLRFLSNASEKKLLATITCDESWFYLNYFEEFAWLHDGEQIAKPKRLISDPEIMIFTAFSTAGIVMIEMLPPNAKFNSTYMCEVILPKLVSEVRKIPGVKPNTKINIHMDNAKPHRSFKTTEKMKQLHLNVLPQPPYSPDISPNDFFLYGYVKEKLKGKIHNTPEELLNSIIEIVQNIEKSVWIKVYKNWITRLRRVINNEGDYI